MFTSIIRTIISTKFQINPLTLTSFSGSGPKSHPQLAKSQNAVGYGVKLNSQMTDLFANRPIRCFYASRLNREICSFLKLFYFVFSVVHLSKTLDCDRCSPKSRMTQMNKLISASSFGESSTLFLWNLYYSLQLLIYLLCLYYVFVPSYNHLVITLAFCVMNRAEKPLGLLK